MIGSGVYLAVWSDRVATDHREQFEHAYGPAGAWSRLFAPQPGYHGSTLDPARRPGEYLTIDQWASKEAFETFIAHHRNEYDALDVELHAVTTSETLVCRGITPRLEPVTGPNQPARRRSTHRTDPSNQLNGTHHAIRSHPLRLHRLRLVLRPAHRRVARPRPARTRRGNDRCRHHPLREGRTLRAAPAGLDSGP